MYIRTYFGICAVPGHSENVYAHICFLFFYLCFIFDLTTYILIWKALAWFAQYDVFGAKLSCTLLTLLLHFWGRNFNSLFFYALLSCWQETIDITLPPKNINFGDCPRMNFCRQPKMGKKMCRLNYQSAISQVRKGWIKGTAQWVASCLLNCIVLCKAKK